MESKKSGQLDEIKDDYDVIIKAGEEQEVLFAHSTVLCCQSNYFRTAFSDNWAEKRNGKYIFTKPNILPHIFKIILSYLYYGQVELNDKSGWDILKLLIATDELGLHTLGESVQGFLINKQKDFLRDDPIGILEIIFQHETFSTINDYCIESICQRPNLSFERKSFSTLSSELFEMVLKRGDLALDEIEVWDYLIKWAYIQNPNIKRNPAKWSKRNVTIMEQTIQRFIPLIRFQDISSKDYHEKIFPYEELLPQNLKNELEYFYMAFDSNIITGILPSRWPSFHGSIIVNKLHLKLFASWIDRKEKDVIYNYNSIPYYFNLILRGNKDGFDARIFHAKCDNKGATIVVAKIKGTNQIVGGYNPLDWNGNWTNKNTPNSFIFSFENYNNMNTGKIGRVIETRYAIYCDKVWGPCFGEHRNSGSDLTVTSNGKWGSVTNSYPNLNIPRNFEVEDYEVFQIVVQ